MLNNKSVFLSQCIRMLFPIFLFVMASSAEGQGCTVTYAGGTLPETLNYGYLGGGAPILVILSYGDCVVPAATASANWIVGLSPAVSFAAPEGGEDTLNFGVLPNPYNVSRTAAVSWWGYTYTIVEAANPSGVPPPCTLSIATSGLPNGTVNSVYPPQTLVAKGGTPPYTWSVSGLPTGLVATPQSDQTVVISGTPTQDGPASVGIQVTDSLGCTATTSLPLTIFTQCGSSTISGRNPTSVTSDQPGLILHAGDVVNLVTTLHLGPSIGPPTPNADGYGIDFMLATSLGDQSFALPVFEQYFALSFSITQDGEQVVGYFQGNEVAPNESSDIEYCVNAPKMYTNAEKKAAANLAEQLSTISDLTGVACEKLLHSPWCLVPEGLVKLAEAHYNYVVSDPADPNYTVIAVPSAPAIPLFAAQAGLTQAQAEAFNSLDGNFAQSIGYASALYTSLNRAQGALKANSPVWEGEQLRAARSYQWNLSQLSNALPAALQQLQSLNLSTVTITPSEVMSLESDIANTGLSPSLLQYLMEFGAGESDITQITSTAVVQDINGVAGAYPAKLANSALISALVQISAATADLNDDGEVNCADLTIVKASFGKTTGQAGFDPRADVNGDGVVNILDLSFVAKQLPTGTVCQ
jgi:hypothetical protein